jgi:CheY-like chemotaxis protein
MLTAEVCLEVSPRVLAVEDDEDLRKILCEHLSAAGYIVKGAGDGIEAVKELEETQWHVVLTDCEMPRMDGLELLRIVKARWPHIPVVMISGEPSGTEKRALQQGVFGWIHKPFDMASLIQMLRAAVQRALELRAPC